ncbi:hypothetical protein SEPCBS119000_006730 [Sporothrix epigloea]|uniref:Uncharacterized protein n=1 Tax=Sporothrix epigloea TaxID=1892477 RepID=A0ABP0E4M8_9PEZI
MAAASSDRPELPARPTPRSFVDAVKITTITGAATLPAKPITTSPGRLQTPPTNGNLLVRPMSMPAPQPRGTKANTQAPTKRVDTRLLAMLPAAEPTKRHPLAVRQALAEAAEISMVDIPLVTSTNRGWALHTANSTVRQAILDKNMEISLSLEKKRSKHCG